MRLYLIRHHKTDWNAKGILQGSMDISISEDIDEAGVSRNQSILQGIAFKHILVSDYQRTKQTADTYGIQDVVIDSSLNEINFGEFEGKPKKTMLAQIGEQWLEDPKSLVFGESMVDFELRLFEFLNKYKHEDHVLAFTHGGVVRGLRAIHKFGSIDRMNIEHVENNQLVILDFSVDVIEKFRRKKILILGAGIDQRAMLEKCSERGYETWGMDKNKDAPGFELVEHMVIGSIKDRDAVLSAAQKIGVDAVTSFITEVSLASMSFVSERLDLNWPMQEEALDATLDKMSMRRILEANNINDLPFCQPDGLREAAEFADQVGFPVVLKTTRSAGQINVYKIPDQQQLQAVYEKHFTGFDSDDLILEKFVSGPEINVVYTVYDGEIKDLIVSDRQTNQDAFGVVKRHECPSKYASEIRGRMRDKCQKINDVLGIRYGVVYPQMIYGPDGDLVMIEIGARVPGGHMKEVMEFASGIDVVSYCLDISLNEIKPYEYYRTIPASKCVFVTFLNCCPGMLRSGRVDRLEVDPACLESENVKAIDYFSTNGVDKLVRPLKQGRDRFIYIITVGQNKREAHDWFRFVLDRLDLVDENGESMINRDFAVEEFYLVNY